MITQIAPSRLRALPLAIVAAVLLWGVVSTSFVAYLAQVSPKAALFFDSHQPVALLELANSGFNGSKAPAAPDGHPTSTSRFDQSFADLANVQRNLTGREPSSPVAVDVSSSAEKYRKITEWTKGALIRDPLNAQGLRILGQLDEVEGNRSGTRGAMQAAARLSIRESVAIDWLMRKSFEASDFELTLYYADVLLRTRPQLIGYVMPTLVRLAEDKAARQSLQLLLAKNPSWRTSFFSELPSRVSDARTPMVLLLGLRDTAVPPTAADLRVYLDFLVAHKFYQLAYYTWLQFLPKDRLGSAGWLYNGNFEISPSGLPFDWVINQGNAVTVDIVDRVDGPGRALSVEFADGRVDFKSVTQLVVLPPGAYHFTSKYRGEVSGPRGMKWRIACASGAPIAESSMMTGMRPEWIDVDVPFTVPADDCGAQYVRLDLDARMASEQFVSGSFRFADIAIARAPQKP